VDPGEKMLHPNSPREYMRERLASMINFNEEAR
jgi:hypothetical protein